MFHHSQTLRYKNRNPLQNIDKTLLSTLHIFKDLINISDQNMPDQQIPLRGGFPKVF